jgi:hypothetical protein
VLLQENATRPEASERRLARIDASSVVLDDRVQALSPIVASGMRAREMTSGRGILEARTGMALPRERILMRAALLQPRGAADVAKVHIGGANDGGYVMLDGWSGLAGAISIGISNDEAWDRAVLARGIPVAQFDHTIMEPPSAAEGLTRQALDLAASDINNVRTLRPRSASRACPRRVARC